MNKSIRKKLAIVSAAVLAAVLLLYILPSFIICDIVIGNIFAKRDREYALYTEETAKTLPREKFYFESGQNTLSGFYYPCSDAQNTVVIVPGLGAGADDYLGETAMLVGAGMSVVSFDPTGCYSSEGDNAVGFEQEKKDLAALLGYMESEGLCSGSLYLLGHSLGAYTAGCILDEIEAEWNIKGAVLVNGFDDPEEMMLESARDKVGFAADIGYPGMLICRGLTSCADGSDTASDSLKMSGKRVLVIQGSGDTTVSPDGCAIYAEKDGMISEKISFVLIPGGHTDVLHGKDGVNRDTFTEITDFFDSTVE